MSDGLLLVDKTPGCTSHDVVQQVRRVFKQKKVGHCGTLDPDATGLLLLTLGKATRLTRFLIRAPKEYLGEIRFGIATDTYDAMGEVTATETTDSLTEDAIREKMTPFVGTYQQAAPAYSAKKHKGVKYYELARKGEAVPEASKEITVFDFEITDPLRDDCLPFKLRCTSGTYVRTLAHDLGREMGCGAHLKTLRRTEIGPFAVESAATLEELESRFADSEELGPEWIPFDAIPLPFSEVVTDLQQERRIVHGQPIVLRDSKCEEGDWIKLMNRRRQLIAVGTVVELIGTGSAGLVQPKIVFG